MWTLALGLLLGFSLIRGKKRVDFGVECQAKNFLKLRVHVLIFIRNVQDIDARQLEPLELHLNPLFVFVLHHENYIRPVKVCFADASISIGSDAGRAHIQSGIFAIEMFRSHTALPIHGANEQNFKASIHQQLAFLPNVKV